MSSNARGRTVLLSLAIVVFSTAVAFSIRSESLTESLDADSERDPAASLSRQDTWMSDRLDDTDVSEAYTEAIADGQANLDAEDYGAALESFNAAIELAPDRPIGYHGRALARLKTEDYEFAIADLDRAIELNPGDARAYGNRGSAHQKLEQYADAFEDYREAIRLDPEYDVPYFNRASLYFELGEYESALQDFNQTLLLRPEYAQAFYNRALVYAHLGDSAAAIADFETAEALFRKTDNFAASEQSLDAIARLKNGTFETHDSASEKRPAKTP